jgi:hypothetical protein
MADVRLRSRYLAGVALLRGGDKIKTYALDL